MKLFLHRSDQKSELGRHYASAFKEAVELYMVTAYLTDSSPTQKLSPGCTRFRFIVGKDFGIARKQACEDVLEWLPARHKADFLVADGVEGFHPRAAFWRNSAGKCFMLVGSSNLS